MAFTVTPRGAGVRFAIHVQPRSKKPGIDGTHGDALRVRVHAPPVEGAANDAVVALLADALGVPSRAVHIAAGQSGRQKLVDVDGVDAARALSRLLAT
ncbi:MAG: DUF167 domain-containing protein [Gemmatimonadetes bacterium]|jgi:uncharacterized protein (TIGR00251 family)|nr:DUF167 domain-containing protein [Gemmatimonadota bacterium]